MTPPLLSRPAPLSSTAPAMPRVDSALRLGLHPVLDRRAVVDGAWWPCSRDAAAELPGLIAAVDRLLDRVTLRIGLHRDTWQSIPHRIPASGRQVRIGWFRHTDPRLITLIFAAGEPVVLLVIPPDTATGPAEAMLKLTAQDTAGLSIDDILTVARLPPNPAAPLRADRLSGRQASQLISASPKETSMTVIDTAPLGVANPSSPTTVYLSGEIDIFSSAALRRQLLNTLHYSTSLLIIDLSQVSFCDAGGLAVLVGIQHRARPMGITLALRAPRPFMSRLLRITGLDRGLPMVA
ncbi:STAS domain-containing protein [Nonomuraea angiospora]|uniref:STAS domain-containing protein n=1 Tax=Nonomuraea angiospora TaxID=46172 RepID=UPI0037B9FF66